MLSRNQVLFFNHWERRERFLKKYKYLLEVWSYSVDFVNQILNTDDIVLAQALFNDGIACDGESLLLDLGEAALVDELAHGLKVGVTVMSKMEQLLIKAK